MTLNQVCAAGWLNETALSNRGCWFRLRGENVGYRADNQPSDGSVDAGRAINHRLLVGIDYQIAVIKAYWLLAAFPPIDAFNPVYGAQPITLRCIAVKT